jgi:hypothetical protein
MSTGDDRRVTLNITTDLGLVFLEADGSTLLQMTPEEAMSLADTLTIAAEPSLILKAVA